MNIAIFVPNCNQGGTERVAARLQGMLNGVGHNITIITMGVKKYPYKIDCEHFALDLDLPRNKVLRILYRYNKLKSIVKEKNIEVIISMGEYPNILTALMPKNIKKIARVTNSFESIKGKLSPIKIATKLVYKNFNAIVVPADYLKSELKKMFGINDKIHTINNFLDISSIESVEEKKFNDNKKRIIHIGQLVEQKAQHLLIDAFSKIKADFENVELLILGEGHLKAELNSLAYKLGIEEDIKFLGWQESPYSWLKSSDIFILTSLWEGMPNVLIESMACSCPVVSFDCPSGPSEIINKQNVNGVLIPLGDVDLIVKETLNLLKDDETREEMSISSLERAKDFDINIIKKQYEKVLEEICVE